MRGSPRSGIKEGPSSYQAFGSCTVNAVPVSVDELT
jgi:hypothetical protein